MYELFEVIDMLYVRCCICSVYIKYFIIILQLTSWRDGTADILHVNDPRYDISLSLSLSLFSLSNYPVSLHVIPFVSRYDDLLSQFFVLPIKSVAQIRFETNVDVHLLCFNRTRYL